MGKEYNSVYIEAENILAGINKNINSPSTKAFLAKIRNSVDKDLLHNIDLLSCIFSSVSYDSGELYNSGESYEELTNKEQAIFTALQLYAIHQQSSYKSVMKIGGDYDEKQKYKDNIGDALSTLRNEESESIDKRFNTMIVSTDYKRLTYHLRQMIKILKSKSDVKVDYAKLAEDLYWFMNGKKEGVRLSWARSYYKYRKNEEMEGDIKNEK